MADTPDRAAVLVCGGTASRFAGGDKVFAWLGDKPLVRHVADRVEPLVDTLVVNCRPNQESTLRETFNDRPVTLAVDDNPGWGPLTGINRGLREADAAYALVVACDMPFVDPEFVELLFEKGEGREAAIPRQEGGWYQPLQSVYAVEPMREATARAMEAGVDRPIEPALDLDHVVVDWETVREYAERGTFFDVNTVEDIETARERRQSER
jgi:molybdopterin-guanine dinucleotide biosynthesis protein A